MSSTSDIVDYNTNKHNLRLQIIVFSVLLYAISLLFYF